MFPITRPVLTLSQLTCRCGRGCCEYSGNEERTGGQVEILLDFEREARSYGRGSPPQGKMWTAWSDAYVWQTFVRNRKRSNVGSWRLTPVPPIVTGLSPVAELFSSKPSTFD